MVETVKKKFLTRQGLEPTTQELRVFDRGSRVGPPFYLLLGSSQTYIFYAASYVLYLPRTNCFLRSTAFVVASIAKHRMFTPRVKKSPPLRLNNDVIDTLDTKKNLFVLPLMNRSHRPDIFSPVSHPRSSPFDVSRTKECWSNTDEIYF